MYVDNPITASARQPDVWTLSTDQIDGESITFGYSNGVSLTTSCVRVLSNNCRWRSSSMRRVHHANQQRARRDQVRIEFGAATDTRLRPARLAA